MSKNKNFIKTAIAASLSLITIGVSSFALTAPQAYADTNSQVTVQAPSISTKNSLAPMIKRVLPAVVSIDVKAVERVQAQNPLDFFGDLLPKQFQDLLGNNGQNSQPVEQNVRQLGSGVIIDAKNGYVVTNYHVIQGAKTIKVKLYDNRTYNATIVGTDPDTDLAVLKLEKFTNLQQITLGDSSTAEIGDFVVAIGNPFGIGLTATQGIVSALNRSTSLNLYDNYIQTDASINSGNSGGALVDLNGNLIGINSAILSKSGGSVGIGFAIPSNIVKSISDQLIKDGKVSRGQIGIRGNDLNQALIDINKIPVTEGAFINEVFPGTAADRAGLKAGDVIIEVNGTKIVDFNQLRSLVSSQPVNTTFDVTYIRNGQTYKTKVTSDRAAVAANSQGSNANAEQAQILGTSFKVTDKGVVVDKLGKNSPFALYGIKSGDQLVSIQDKDVKSIKDVNEALDKLNNEDLVVFKFLRDNRTIFITIQNR
ncbi:hypothetical protein CJP74_02900 [Psittacicella melopsittaci]|uniref:PDZ domain-containing protein n=1 Tax=Psittacicella melopsittaci TaxID=2028576 RepID=A0A3A1Y6F3_9GAMM|nr:Do family serine endopeptidase [Psittacicella melopsittaci]RIY33091.1 hypothetical protein CJP74_02900 [Psittacicella melopsittaci]